MTQYVEHQFIRAVIFPSAALADGWPGHVEAVLRRKAIDAGTSLTGPVEQVGDAIPVQVETDDGVVDALSVVYRAGVSGPAVVTEATVEAAETAPGVWAADVPPGVVILSIRHGLGTRRVDVSMVDADGFPAGYVAPVPISGSEVEVVLGVDSQVRRAFVKVEDEDEDGEQRPDVQSPRQVDA